MDHNNAAQRQISQNVFHVSSARFQTIELMDINNTQGDELVESGYLSMLESSREITVSTDSPIFSSTPLNLTHSFSRSRAESSNTPRRPPSPVHAEFVDLITSLHSHEPRLLHTVFSYLEPRDLHNFSLAKREWKVILLCHCESRKRLLDYRKDLRDRRENIPRFVSEEDFPVRISPLETARAVLSQRGGLRDLSNIQPVERSQNVTMPVLPSLRQPFPSVEVAVPAVSEPRRRPLENPASRGKKKPQKLSRLRLK